MKRLFIVDPSSQLAILKSDSTDSPVPRLQLKSGPWECFQSQISSVTTFGIQVKMFIKVLFSPNIFSCGQQVLIINYGLEDKTKKKRIKKLDIKNEKNKLQKSNTYNKIHCNKNYQKYLLKLFLYFSPPQRLFRRGSSIRMDDSFPLIFQVISNISWSLRWFKIDASI